MSFGDNNQEGASSFPTIGSFSRGGSGRGRGGFSSFGNNNQRNAFGSSRGGNVFGNSRGRGSSVEDQQGGSNTFGSFSRGRGRGGSSFGDNNQRNAFGSSRGNFNTGTFGQQSSSFASVNGSNQENNGSGYNRGGRAWYRGSNDNNHEGAFSRGGRGRGGLSSFGDNDQGSAFGSSRGGSNRGPGGSSFGDYNQGNGFGSSRGGNFGSSRGNFNTGTFGQQSSSFAAVNGSNQENNGSGYNRGGRAWYRGSNDNNQEGAVSRGNGNRFDRSSRNGNYHQENNGFSRHDGGDGRFGGGASHDRDHFNQDSNHRSGGFKRERAFQSATILPSGQVENHSFVPVPVPITAADKEEFGEEIEKKLTTHAIPRTHAEFGFQPKVREVGAIFNEDEKHANDYASVIDEDDDIHVIGVTGGELSLLDNWTDARFNEKLYENIKRAKYIRPRKLQRSVIPLLLDDGIKCNLKVTAETGSGKTAAFLLPIVDECIVAKKNRTFATEPYTPYAVILEPTRELALQVCEQAQKFTDGTGISVGKAYGEYTVTKNKKELMAGCDILCATPGRFCHFVQEKCIKLDKVRFLVFDEGDRLMTPDFGRTIQAALFGCEPKISDDRQTLFFSATFNDELNDYAKRYISKGPIVTIKGASMAPSKKVVQEFRLQNGQYKFAGIRNHFVEELQKVGGDVAKLPRTFVFCNTSEYCEKLALALQTQHGINTIPMNGMRGQDLREEALRNFRDNEASVLVGTDVCSRGIDIKDADVVINCEMPGGEDGYETYVHRVGRAGRIRQGRCISFVKPETDRDLLLKIREAMQRSGQIIPPSLEEILGKEPPQALDANVEVEEASVAATEAAVSPPEAAKEESVVAAPDVSTKDPEAEKEEGEVTDSDGEEENAEPDASVNDEEEKKPETGDCGDDEGVDLDEKEDAEEKEEE